MAEKKLQHLYLGSREEFIKIGISRYPWDRCHHLKMELKRVWEAPKNYQGVYSWAWAVEQYLHRNLVSHRFIRESWRRDRYLVLRDAKAEWYRFPQPLLEKLIANDWDIFLIVPFPADEIFH